MTAYVLPVVAGASTFETIVILDAVPYVLRFNYNVRDAAWYLSITSSGTTPQLTIKVVPSWELLRRFGREGLPPGSLLVYDTSGSGVPPGELELGQRVVLIYVDEAGTAELKDNFVDVPLSIVTSQLATAPVITLPPAAPAPPILTYTLDGTVLHDGALTPHPGVTLALTGDAVDSDVSDVNGDYTFSGVLSGNYTITPSLVGYTFNPVSLPVTVTIGNQSGLDFLSTPSGFSCGVPAYTLITHTSEQKLVPASLTSSDAMGGQHSVAISGDGTTVAIGAPGFENGGTSRGAVFVYTLSAGTWSLQATLVHSAAANSDLLGDGVCISDDGNTVMSSIKRTTGEAVIVWTRSAGVWTQGTSITPTTVSTVANWGNSIVMNHDGTRVACTSWGEAGGNRIWVFDYNAGVWSETIVITPTPMYTSSPGIRLAMSTDGNYLVAGDPFNVSGGAGRGYAHIYYKDQGGTNLWGEQAAFQSQTPANNDNYGRGVAINCDGSVAAFGWPGRTDVVAQAGGVEIYKRTGVTWTYSALCDSTSNLTSELGRSVAISGDGKIVIAGGPTYSSSRGRVHLFNDQNDDNVWVENEWWQMTGIAASDLFGEAVCFPRSAGGYVVIGVPGDDDNGAGCGAAVSWQVFT